MPLTPAENYYRAVLFESPEWVPMIFAISTACWDYYDHGELQGLKTGGCPR